MISLTGSKTFALFIARRYTLWGQHSQLVNFLSLITMVGIILAVAVLVAVLSVMNGFDRELRERILGLVPQFTISAQPQRGVPSTQQWEKITEQLKAFPDVVAFSTWLPLEGMLVANGRSKGLSVQGIEPTGENKVSIIDELLIEGEFSSLQPGSFQLLIGQGIAKSLQLTIGDEAMLVSTVFNITPLGEFPRQKQVTIGGIYSSGSALDQRVVMMHVEDARTLYRLSPQDKSIRVKLRDLFAVFDLEVYLYQVADDSWFYRDWTLDYGGLYENIRLSKSMVAMLLSLLIAVASFNIIVSLVMVVREKQGEIAILRSMGTPRKVIAGIFMIQGSLIGFFGSLMGLLLGCLLAYGAQTLLPWYEKLTDTQVLQSDIYPVNFLPVQVQLFDLLVVVFTTLILSFLATIYPALKAAAMPPAEVLRQD